MTPDQIEDAEEALANGIDALCTASGLPGSSLKSVCCGIARYYERVCGQSTQPDLFYSLAPAGQAAIKETGT